MELVKNEFFTKFTVLTTPVPPESAVTATPVVLSTTTPSSLGTPTKRKEWCSDATTALVAPVVVLPVLVTPCAKVRRTNAIRERAVLNQYQDADPSTKITWLYGLYQKYQADIDLLVENDRGWYKKNVAMRRFFFPHGSPSENYL